MSGSADLMPRIDGARNRLQSAKDQLSEARGMLDKPEEQAPKPKEEGGGLFGNLSLSDVGHTLLDGAGMIPGLGAFADGANAVWYAVEGDWTNAGLSAMGAIPIAGDAATAARLANRATDAVRVADNSTDVARSADTARTHHNRPARNTNPDGSRKGADEQYDGIEERRRRGNRVRRQAEQAGEDAGEGAGTVEDTTRSKDNLRNELNKKYKGSNWKYVEEED